MITSRQENLIYLSTVCPEKSLGKIDLLAAIRLATSDTAGNLVAEEGAPICVSALLAGNLLL